MKLRLKNVRWKDNSWVVLLTDVSTFSYASTLRFLIKNRVLTKVARKLKWFKFVEERNELTATPDIEPPRNRRENSKKKVGNQIIGWRIGSIYLDVQRKTFKIFAISAFFHSIRRLKWGHSMEEPISETLFISFQNIHDKKKEVETPIYSAVRCLYEFLTCSVNE